jgi:transposase, IS5 family
MQLFEAFQLRFEQPDWSASPHFGLIDIILEENPGLVKIVEDEVVGDSAMSNFGRQDSPSVEQVLRAGIFKEIRGLDYRELEFAQTDSRICEAFLKIDPSNPYSFSTWQKYISRISASSLHKVMVEINLIGISEGAENLRDLRLDTTVVETNIHHPTNSSLVWDSIREAHRLLTKLSESWGVKVTDHTRKAKSLHFQISNARDAQARQKLFTKQLRIFTKSIQQVDRIVKKKDAPSTALDLAGRLEKHLEVMRKVYSMAFRKEVLGESVPVDEKLFSIYEQHTDLIVKGKRKAEFGHKVSLAGGRSNMLLDVQVLDGNPADSTTMAEVIDRIVSNYEAVPERLAGDGGYSTRDNFRIAAEAGITTVVFNKLVGSLRNKVSSRNLETRLKKWRSGIEAVISNLKRGFNIRRCTWKGRAHFDAKVLWSALAYNICVLTTLAIKAISG